MICKICGKEFANSLNSFGYHLSITHKIKYKDYYDKFLKQPNEGLCKICNKPTNWRNNHYLTYCSCKCKQRDPEIIKAQQDTMLKKYGAKTTLESEILRKKVENTCIEKYDNINPGSFGSNIFKNSMLIKYNTDCYLNLLTDEERKINAKLGWTEEAKQKREETILKNYGVTHTSKSHEILSKMRKKYIYNNLKFDSSWEIAYYIWLKDHNIEFEYQPNISFEYEYNGKIHKYFPDFKINNLFYEIKGGHLLKRMLVSNTLDNAKYLCMLKNNINIIDNCTEYLNYVNEKYGKIFLHSCRTK
jgi:hypothetical protein